MTLSPKFYFFDVGVARALAHMLTIKPKDGTSYYGELFESFIIMECIKLAKYYELDFKFSYLMTGAGVEVDLVVERPGQPLLLIEIKSSEEVSRESLTSLQNLSQDLMPCEVVCFSREKRKRKLEHITIYPWESGVKKYFTGK